MKYYNFASKLDLDDCLHTEDLPKNEHTWFDDCYPCINCLKCECEGCIYDLMHKGNQDA